MAHDHENRYVQDIDSKFERVNDRLIENAADRADGKDIAETFVKNDFRRYTRVRAGENSSAWVLTGAQTFAGFLILPWMHSLAACKALIAFEHARPDRICLIFFS